MDICQRFIFCKMLQNILLILQNECENKNNNAEKTTNYKKNAVLNLCVTDILVSHNNFLNLGPHFVPSLKLIPYMDIINSTESSALKLEYDNKIGNAQDLRKNVLKELKTGKKVKNNLTKEQWKSYKEKREEKNIDIYPFEKGTGFVRIEHSKALEKTRKQIGQTKIVSEDPTANYAAIIRRYLSKLNKRNCLSKKEYEKIYPSDPIPPCMYDVIKAHKPEKFYPMRIIICTIGTANYGTSEFLVKIIQPVLNENMTRLKNSFDFIKKAESWKIDNDELQVSFDVVNLYPSVPLKEATLVLIEKLNNNTTYKKLTRLSIPEIKQLIELCLFQCYIHWNNEIHIIKLGSNWTFVHGRSCRIISTVP
ncbi:uncharacterized protein LOC136072401 [Hydra vulgaris]|uniref:uncharacterized protein LOC136072401 n=1 Tax=Hydra vulgaris TaxID=6087 RepID=UPI0032E9D488